MKSQILRKFESKLEEINDQFCYFLFSDVEISNIFLELAPDISNSFTTEVFPKNEFSNRLNVEINALSEFRNKSFHTLVSMNVIASVEYLLSFIDEIESFRSEIMFSGEPEINSNITEEQLEIKLTNWLGRKPESAIIKTIKYLRLRRNHIAHVRKDLSKEYYSLIKNDSNHLNTYWSKQSTKLNGFDFSKESCLEFDVNEVFALINLSRICMREVDATILSTIPKEAIVKYELLRFLENKKNKGLELDTQSRKLNVFLRNKYGEEISCSDSVLRSYLKNSK